MRGRGRLESLVLDGDPDVTLELRASEATVSCSPCSSSLTAERGTSVEKVSEFVRLEVAA
jgi:hypothetical protein